MTTGKNWPVALEKDENLARRINIAPKLTAWTLNITVPNKMNFCVA